MPTPAARVALTAAGAVAATAAAGIGYAAGYEVRAFQLRRVELPVLPRGQRPLRVLHLSDLHLLPGQRRKREWVRALAALEPHFVVDTGDNIAHPEAVPALFEALEPLLERPGAFVLGSNDYFAPRAKNPVRYLLPGAHRRKSGGGEQLPWPAMVRGMRAAGWADLSNRRTLLPVDGRTLELVGVDDPHIHLDRLDGVRGAADPSADLTIGVTHAPYRRVLDAFTQDGAPLLLAGHTHGGQLCVPWFGAIITNCDLDRRQAKGLSRWSSGDRHAWLHVSAGLGTSPYAPVRFACRPEATLLTLRAKP